MPLHNVPVFLGGLSKKIAGSCKKPGRVLVLCALAGGFCFAGESARAAESGAPAAQDKEIRSGEVVVTAGRVEQELLDVPMSVSVVTGEDIRRSSAGTVGDLLRDVPGVEIINSGGQGFNRVSIRGEDATRVLVLIDGQKIVENKSMEGPPLLISPALIERIEVIRGPASVLYGSEAIGGVVNIITKKGGTEPVEGEVGGLFNGSNSGLGGFGSVFGKASGFSYRVFGYYADHDDLRTPNGRANNTGYRTTNGNAFLSYDWEKLTVGGAYQYFDSSLHAGSMAEGYEDFGVDIPTWRLEKYSAFAEFKELSEWLPRLRFDVFTQENHKHMFNHVGQDMGFVGSIIMDNEADNYNEQFGASGQADWMIGDAHYLITGYEFNRDRLNAHSYADVTTTGMLGMMSPSYNSTTRHKVHQDTHAVYAQMESSLPLDFTLNYGMRYTWVRSKVGDIWGTKTIRATGVTSPLDAGGGDGSSESRPVFNVGLMWSGIDNLTLRATFGQGFRAPNLQEMYIVSSMGGGTIYPNSDLDPEKSNNYELGARYSGEKLMIDAAVFYADADDYIYNERIGGTNNSPIYQYVNVASARTHGLELAASYDLPYGLTPYLSGTWMKRKFDYGTHSTWKSGTPEFRARAGLRGLWAVNEFADFRTDVYGRFSSEAESETSGGVVTRHAGWGTANLSMGFDFGDTKQYTVNAELLNIFDKAYTQTDAIYEPGIHLNLNFSMKF